jgi:D-cysteine desulfhydrase
VSTLRERLDAFPRVALGPYPTPLDPLPRLSVALRRRVLIKRDDLPGPALGGNKARKLEYLMADALAGGARRVATFGGLQSNHARMTAAAARRLGMEPHLLYFARRPRRLTGNLAVCEALGAHMHFIPIPQGGEPGFTLERLNRLVALLARALVGPHYFIPVGGHSWLGCLGYARAALELDEQARAAGAGDARVVLAAGTGGTLAGLLAGLALCGSGLRPLAVDVGRLWRRFPESVAAVATEICARLGEPRAFAAADVPLLERVYVGERYGVPSPEGDAALRRLALLEGVVLDPIYTAKALAGLLDRAERGLLGRDEPLIFLHTGGGPGFFA